MPILVWPSTKRGTRVGTLPPAKIPPPPRKLMRMHHSRFPESQEAFLLYPQEGITEDSPPAAVVEPVAPEYEPPLKKTCQDTTPAPLVAESTPSLGEVFLPLISGILAPFGLPSAPVDSSFAVTLAPMPTSPSKGTGESSSNANTPAQSPQACCTPGAPAPKDSTPPPMQESISTPPNTGTGETSTQASIPAPPSQPGDNSGQRKNRRDTPRTYTPFDPFTRRRTAPRPVVGSTRPRLTAQRKAAPVTTPSSRQVEVGSDVEHSLASDVEESILIASGNLRLPDPTVPSGTVPNPPFVGSESTQN